jgi:hypothetical protein
MGMLLSGGVFALNLKFISPKNKVLITKEVYASLLSLLSDR